MYKQKQRQLLFWSQNFKDNCFLFISPTFSHSTATAASLRRCQKASPIGSGVDFSLCLSEEMIVHILSFSFLKNKAITAPSVPRFKTLRKITTAVGSSMIIRAEEADDGFTQIHIVLTVQESKT